MVRKFAWKYIKVLAVIAVSIAFGWLILGWDYGFQTLLKNEVYSDVDLVAELIIILIVAFIATTVQVFIEGRRR